MAAPIRKSGGRQEVVEPPQMPKPRRGVFEGDAAAVELRSRLARLRLETPIPAQHKSPTRPHYAVLRPGGLLLVAAVAAGAAGYLLGDFGVIAWLRHIGPVLHINGLVPRIDPAKTSGARGGADLMPVPPRPAANFGAYSGGSQPAPQTVAADVMRADWPRAAVRKEAAPPLAIPVVPTQDRGEISAKMKLGADLLASGDVAAARLMFARVAEAGEAAGAFALAETYDPAVLRTLRLRGAIAGDQAAARHWYEQARDMGSAAAVERIARLAQSTP
jgi:hypothetical protein